MALLEVFFSILGKGALFSEFLGLDARGLVCSAERAFLVAKGVSDDEFETLRLCFGFCND